TEQAIRNGSAYLVLLASDASEGTRKKFNDHCQYYDVPICYVSSKEVLGKVLGKEYRAVGAVIDENLSAVILKQYDQETCR
ncbi:MAG: ribosomal L7Ae/L30e/S12e/Gadd45 family protein, partial [Lachnospiraceae bacterium]|nr:ribosomal L7Ae/L30e/S12e/Gadd45 family protein [Candidatus Equihabitans merdae]